MSMFCYQCQETAKGTGCTIKGVCGKTDEVANMQDLLIYVTKGVSVYAQIARANGIESEKVNQFVFDALFVTITNANFDYDAIVAKVKNGLTVREEIKNELIKAGISIPEKLHSSATWTSDSVEEFERKSKIIGVLSIENEDLRSLKELLTYGVKGMAAYAEHAFNLGYNNNEIHAFMQKALVATTEEKTADELSSSSSRMRQIWC
jgi:hydroxylamine reductase